MWKKHPQKDTLEKLQNFQCCPKGSILSTIKKFIWVIITLNSMCNFWHPKTLLKDLSKDPYGLYLFYEPGLSEGLKILGVHVIVQSNVLVQIGLTDLPKTGGGGLCPLGSFGPAVFHLAIVDCICKFFKRKKLSLVLNCFSLQFHSTFWRWLNSQTNTAVER